MGSVRVETDAGVAVVTLDEPERRNALTLPMVDEIVEVFDGLERTDSVGAVVVTGAPPAFCAGADLGGGGSTFDWRERRRDELDDEPCGADSGEPPLRGRTPRDGGGQVSLRIFESRKPVIAAINGAAVGVGITMTLPMDVRLAAEGAKIGFVFVRRGIVPEACSSWFLPRIVGISQAMEWVATGRVFTAEEALAGRLVRSVHPPDELLPTAYAIAREIAENTSAVSVALPRQMLWKMLGADHPMEAHKIDSRGIFEMGRQADVREGVTSFLEKRPPKFPMRVSTDMPPYFPWWQDRPFG